MANKLKLCQKNFNPDFFLAKLLCTMPRKRANPARKELKNALAKEMQNLESSLRARFEFAVRFARTLRERAASGAYTQRSSVSRIQNCLRKRKIVQQKNRLLGQFVFFMTVLL